MTDAAKDKNDEVTPAPADDPGTQAPPEPIETPPRKQPDSHVAGL